MAPDYDDAAIRGLAIARAHRMLAQCFKPDAFSVIMKSLDPTKVTEEEFINVCISQDVKLKRKEAEWLWAYLQHCDTAVYGPCPEAAASGW